ncbi:MAG: DUF2953 domain-containing protein [Bacillota bacterium]
MLYGIGLVLLAAGLALLIPVHVRVSFRAGDEGNWLTVMVLVLGLLPVAAYRLRAAPSAQADPAALWRKYLRFPGQAKAGLESVRSLAAKFRPRVLEARLRVGMGDPSCTGVVAGLAWAAGGNLVALARAWWDWPEGQPKFEVVTDFESRSFGIAVNCILTTRTVHIIHAARLTAKLRAKGVEHGRASDPGPDEDRHGEHQRDGRGQHHRRRSSGVAGR